MSSQTSHPRRAVVRTVFQATLAFAALWPIVVPVLGLPGWSWLVASVAAAGAICRVMALPVVEDFLQEFVPWLSAEPPNRRAG